MDTVVCIYIYIYPFLFLPPPKGYAQRCNAGSSDEDDHHRQGQGHSRQPRFHHNCTEGIYTCYHVAEYSILLHTVYIYSAMLCDAEDDTSYNTYLMEN